MKKKKSTVTMKTDELIEEHTRLVKVLKSPSHKDDLEEAKHQMTELKSYKRKRNV